MDIHKQAVEFRNKKRKEYLNNELSQDEMRYVEQWDCEPSKEIIKMAYSLEVKPPKKMFNVDLKEEPLSVDIRLKAMEYKN